MIEPRRKFGGEIYYFRAERNTKKEAERLKNVIKDSGKKARITHTGGRYQVWVLYAVYVYPV
jgi:hypothetical protein